MTTQEYISSGVLESYVMGELNEQEMRKVECMALVHDEISAELTQIEITYEELAQQTSVSPSDSLKGNIWADIESNEPAEQTPVINIANDGGQKKSINWAQAASIAAIIGLGAVVWNSSRQNDVLEAELKLQQTEQENLAEQLAASDNRTLELSNDLAIVSGVDFTPVRLSGTDNAPSASAQVYWNQTSSEVYLSVNEMADLASGKVYQLWILDDGLPIDAGTFVPTDKTGLVKMKDVAKGQTFAVTIEKEGGSLTPALETLQVIGNVTS